jgi:copper(I)-binding protein
MWCIAAPIYIIKVKGFIMQFRSLITLAAALIISASASAHEYKVGDLRVAHPHARATVPHQPSGAAYFGIENTGKSTDKLVAVASPVAKTAQIHTMSMDGNVMKMREVQNIEIPPSGKIVMKPGDGYHIMLMGLNQQLKPGDKFPLTLTFEKAGKIDVSVLVDDKDKEAKSSKDATMSHDHMNHQH